MGNKNQLDIERKEFLLLCSPYDNDLLTNKDTMTLQDFERITYLTMALGFIHYTQDLNQDYMDFTVALTKKLDSEFNILEEYPSYFHDEKEYEKYQNWIDDFCKYLPADKLNYYRRKIADTQSK